MRQRAFTMLLTPTTRHTSAASYPTRGVSDIANRTHAITSLLESAAAGDVKQLESDHRQRHCHCQRLRLRSTQTAALSRSGWTHKRLWNG